VPQAPVSTKRFELAKEESQQHERRDHRADQQQRARRQKPREEQRREQRAGPAPPRGKRAMEQHRPDAEQRTLHENEPTKARKTLDRVDGQLKQPVHVDPRPTRRAERERIAMQERAARDHFAPSREVPPNVAVRRRRQACARCGQEHQHRQRSLQQVMAEARGEHAA
jgi:hypothetical protein